MAGNNVINGKIAFYIFLSAIAIVVFTVYVLGIDIKRSIYENSIYSLSIVNLFFLVTITFGLYHGVKLKDDFGEIIPKLKFAEPGNGSLNWISNLPFVETENILIGVLLWIFIALLSILFFLFFETILVSGIIIITGIFYWIFFRASRLIFRYSRFTKNNLKKSILISLQYSFLYSIWIYGIIWLAYNLRK